MPEDTSFQLVNVKGLTKPATVLIEKVSGAIGAALAPWQIKRVAKAEGEAAIIKAQANIQITKLQQRALYRLLGEEVRRQENIEAIMAKALPHLKDTGNPGALEKDWITNFFDKCRIVSDEEMQSLWSRVLAGEANVPGTFSKRTVNFISDLDKAEAELFTKFCGFCYREEDGSFLLVVFDEQLEIYNKHGVDFGTVLQLESIGLIQRSSEGVRRTSLPKKFNMSYHGKSLGLEMPKDTDNGLDVGLVVLTQIGAELAPICGSEPVDGFFDYVKEQWKQYLPKPTTEQGAGPESPKIANPLGQPGDSEAPRSHT